MGSIHTYICPSLIKAAAPLKGTAAFSRLYTEQNRQIVL